MKKQLLLTSLVVVLLGASGYSMAEDRCTAQLSKYIDMLERNAMDSDVSAGQREASRKLLDKVERLKADSRNSDCAIFDKLLP